MTAALKRMKKHKAPSLSGLTAEMIQAAGDIGTQWILDLCNGIVKEGCIPEDWKSSVVLPIYKGKGDPMECGSYRGIKLLEHAMKVVERIFEYSIRGMKVNMNKTKVMISGERQKQVQKAVRSPCGVCGRGVSSSSIQCITCQKWVHKKCSGIKGSMVKVIKSFTLKAV